MSKRKKTPQINLAEVLPRRISDELAAKDEAREAVRAGGVKHFDGDSLANLAIRKQVASMMLQRVKPTEIADTLKIPLDRVYKINASIMRDWREELKKDKNLIRSREIARLDAYEKRLAEGFEAYMAAGNFELAGRVYDRIHKVIEFRGELHGLRMPKHGAMGPMQGTQVTINTFEYEGTKQINAPIPITVTTVPAHATPDTGHEAANKQ
jgi:hypothetical protein